jgi:hypothetical protein
MKGGARTEKKKTPKTPKFRLMNSAYGKKTRKSIKSSVKTSHPEAYLKNIQSYLTSILNQVDSGYLSEKAFENYTAIAMAIVEETTPVVGNIGKTIQVNENENDVFKYIESLHSIIDELIDEYNDARRNNAGRRNLNTQLQIKEKMYALANSINRGVEAGKRLFISINRQNSNSSSRSSKKNNNMASSNSNSNSNTNKGMNDLIQMMKTIPVFK